MLRKIILLFIILILLIVGLLPFLDGYWFKRTYLNSMNVWNQTFKNKIKVLDYQQGWFTSVAKLSIQQDQTNIPPEYQRYNTPIYVDQKIYHGPIIFDRGIKIAAANIISKIHIDELQALLGVTSETGLITVNSISKFNHSYTNHFVMPPVTKQFPNKVTINWKGLSGDSEIIANGRIEQVISNMTVGDFSLDMPNHLYAIKTGVYTSQSDLIVSSMQNLWNMTHNSNLSTLSLFVLGKEFINLTSLQTLLKTHVANNNLYNGVVNISLDKLILPGSYTIQPASLNLSIENLDATKIAEWLALPREKRKDQIENILPKFITALSKGKLDLSVNTANGRLFATGEVVWIANDLPTTIEMIKDKTNFQVEIRISETLLNQLITTIDGTSNDSNPAIQGQTAPTGPTMRTQIDNLITAGYLIKDKEDYVSTIVGTENKITVNGKPFPMPTMPGVGIPILPQPIPQTNPAIPSAQPVSPPPSAPQPIRQPPVQQPMPSAPMMPITPSQGAPVQSPMPSQPPLPGGNSGMQPGSGLQPPTP